MKDIVILLFDGFDALDIFGPYEALVRLPGYNLIMAGNEKRDFSDSYGLKLKAEYDIGEVDKTKILLIPGGYGILDVIKDDKGIIKWIRDINRKTQYTLSVGSGSLLLAEAGLLTGRNCTTHWRQEEKIKKYNVKFEHTPYVQDGKYITASGISAGIDMAFYLISQIAGEGMAKIIQTSL